jgi:hypothetical protein
LAESIFDPFAICKYLPKRDAFEKEKTGNQLPFKLTFITLCHTKNS